MKLTLYWSPRWSKLTWSFIITFLKKKSRMTKNKCTVKAYPNDIFKTAWNMCHISLILYFGICQKQKYTLTVFFLSNKLLFYSVKSDILLLIVECVISKSTPYRYFFFRIAFLQSNVIRRTKYGNQKKFYLHLYKSGIPRHG